MAAKLYRFKIELSDVEKSSYQSLDFRVAQHPSETLSYLLTRVIAYSLSYEDGIEFSAAGLSDPEAPTLRVANHMGDTKVWIEIGNPSAKRIHKASKAAPKVKIFTYKDPQVLLNEMATEQIHRRNEIEIYSIPAAALDRLAEKIKKENRWTLIFMDRTLMINGDDLAEEIAIGSH